MTRAELIARLEAASEGSRELDVLIADAIGIPKRKMQFSHRGQPRWGWNHDSHGGVDEWFRDPPALSRSLDAAMALVPKGWSWKLIHEPVDGLYRVVIRHAPALANVAPAFVVSAATPALALVIAALRARETGDQDAG